MELSPSDNKIKELPSELNIPNFSNIKSLDLSGNHLESLDESILPPALHFLSLRNNRIPFLSQQTVNFLQRLIDFKLDQGKIRLIKQ